MKIHQLLSHLSIMFTNEENNFLQKHDHVKINSLDEHSQWIAQNLVRKGAYKISNDDQTLIKNLHERNS